MSINRRDIFLFPLFLVVLVVSLTPIIFSSDTYNEISTDWRFYSGTGSSSGPIFFSEAFTSTIITQSGGLVRFTDFNMGSSWSAIGFSMDTSSANVTVVEVLENRVTLNCNAPSGLSSLQFYGGGKGVPASITGALNWTYQSGTDIVQTFQNHTSPVEIVISYGAGGEPWEIDIQVVNSSGLGIEDATVTLVNATDTIFSVSTDSNGDIAQQSVNSGNYTLAVTKDGYLTDEHDYEITIDENWVIRLFEIGDLNTSGSGANVIILLVGLTLLPFIVKLVR